MKQILYKSSIVFPILFGFYIYNNSTEIYIHELNFYIADSLMPMAVFAFTIIWLQTSPFKSGCDGTFFELLFSLIPMQCVLFLIFAQYHFYIAIILIGTLVISNAAFNIYLHRLAEGDTSENDGLWIARERGSVLSMFVVMLVPSFIAMFVYNLQSPLYQSKQEIWNSIFDDVVYEQVIDKKSEHPDFFSFFQLEQWEILSLEEKTALLQQLADFEANKLGIPHRFIVNVEKLDAYTQGSQKFLVLQLDYAHVKNDACEEVIHTLLHEVYHGFQEYVTDNINWDDEFAESAYFAEAREWRNNISSYVPAEYDYEAYKEQPLEASANEYAETETKWIYSVLGGK